MFEKISAQNEVPPNFLNEESRLAEQRLTELMDMAKNIGVELFSLEMGKEEIIEHVRAKLPQRYDLVVGKLREEGLRLEDLSKDMVLDRMLGIDIIFRYEDKNYSVDVTIGQSTVLKNKNKKIAEMEDIYKQIGIDRALIIRLKEDVTEDTVMDLFSKLEDLEQREGVFSAVIRYPEPLVETKY